MMYVWTGVETTTVRSCIKYH